MDAMQTLLRDRWMMVVRGLLAGAFGFALLGWDNLTLPVVIVLFAAYVFLDGLWTIVTAMAAQSRWRDAWPMAVEGLTGAVVGVIAFGWPLRVPRELIAVIVTWAVLTALAELVMALRMPRNTAGFWLFATAGLTSLSLAALLVIVRHADVELVARLIGGYAVIFGATMVLVTARFPYRRRHARAHGSA